LHRFLSQGGWFGGLPRALQDTILERSTVRRFTKGQVINVEDSPADALFAILEGTVHMVRDPGGGEESLIHVGEPGFWFGAMAVLTNNPIPATAIARTPVRALMLTKTQVDRIVDEEPRYYAPFAKLALDRFALLVRMFAELRDLSPEARLRARLVNLAHLRQQDRDERGVLSLSVSQADLARMVGVSRQTLNTLLGRLAREGVIELAFRKIRVLQPARLMNPNAPLEDDDSANRASAGSAATRSPRPPR